MNKEERDRLRDEEQERNWAAIRESFSGIESYAKTVIDSLNAITSGALIHERNSRLMRIDSLITVARSMVESRDSAITGTLRELLKVADSAVGWMARATQSRLWGVHRDQ